MARYEFAAQFVRGKCVLDIACGTGYAAPILLEAGATRYQGSDIQEHLIDNAIKSYGSARATFDTQDITRINESNNHDVITCFETIEHIENYRLALRKLYKSLRPGGLLLISSPNRIITSPGAKNITDKPDNKHHTQEFTPHELIGELHHAGFSIEPKAVYGQRQRPYFRGKFLTRALRVFRPDERTSPKVTKVRWLTPRYFIIYATKPISDPIFSREVTISPSTH